LKLEDGDEVNLEQAGGGETRDEFAKAPPALEFI
jgi:hypothetical protein